MQLTAGARQTSTRRHSRGSTSPRLGQQHHGAINRPAGPCRAATSQVSRMGSCWSRSNLHIGNFRHCCSPCGGSTCVCYHICSLSSVPPAAFVSVPYRALPTFSSPCLMQLGRSRSCSAMFNPLQPVGQMGAACVLVTGPMCLGEFSPASQ